MIKEFLAVTPSLNLTIIYCFLIWFVLTTISFTPPSPEFRPNPNTIPFLNCASNPEHNLNTITVILPPSLILTPNSFQPLTTYVPWQALVVVMQNRRGAALQNYSLQNACCALGYIAGNPENQIIAGNAGAMQVNFSSLHQYPSSYKTYPVSFPFTDPPPQFKPLVFHYHF